MGLDIRLPIGMMFVLLGVLMAGYGIATGSDPEFYKCSLDININLVWGSILLLFGGGMWFFAWRDAAKK